jgi:hypothetical protein
MRNKMIWATTLFTLVMLLLVTSCGSSARDITVSSATLSSSDVLIPGNPGATVNQPGNFQPGTSGTVQVISGNTITINTRDNKTINVITSDSTTIRKTVSGQLSDITSGTSITVSGNTNTDGSILATSISIMPSGAIPNRTQGNPSSGTLPPGTINSPDIAPPSGVFGGRGTSGTVQVITGNTITITTRDNKTVSVATSNTTSVQMMTTGQLSDIIIGVSITVSGEIQQDGSIKATSISITPDLTTP